MVKAANSRLRTLVTTTATAAKEEGVLNLIDLWVPILNDLSLERRRGSVQYCEQKAISCTGAAPLDQEQRSHYDFVKPVRTFKPNIAGNVMSHQVLGGCRAICGLINRA